MENKKIANLLRSVADLLDEITVSEQTKSETKDAITETPKKNNRSFGTLSQEEAVKKISDLMKRVDETEKVRSFKRELTKKDEKLKSLFEEIENMRNAAIETLHGDLNEVVEGKGNLISKILEIQKSTPLSTKADRLDLKTQNNTTKN